MHAQDNAQKDAHAQGDAHKMTSKERRQEIIKILEENPEISTLELSKIFSVSRSTISRDLRKLQRVAQGDAQDNAQNDTQNDTQNITHNHRPRRIRKHRSQTFDGSHQI
ncbi:MAG: HTH domain-containing protein [Finegoldia sp.]|uniref:HTH domain-containing protein n=1 Tax=Finegoldia sp. TaxID=1981334 RepID=UPI0039959859